MFTLESTIVTVCAISLVALCLLAVPPLYQAAYQAARVEVLCVYESMTRHSLYQANRIAIDSSSTIALVTAPQRMVELARWVGDVIQWGIKGRPNDPS
jgi:hypothetical protein